ncbi:FkbM family methyltransferase [candidate division CSSED10-310 bacterium]|uniref:FkbM family methyltransferase n=1 Tax=candidate division CSSED10-310 bacterium TaxID=2855610 RepID=A0ABV6YYT5_UNCC1
MKKVRDSMVNTKVLKTLKKIIRLPFNTIGLELIKKRQKGRNDYSMQQPSWQERLQHAKDLGFSAQVIFDGGAFNGLWTKDVSQIFPGSQIVLFEPNPYVQDIIIDNISDLKPSPIVLNIALGESCGNSTLNIWNDDASDSGASLLNHVRGQSQRAIKVKVDSLDNIAQKLKLNPNLIKLDLQGGELLALKGGRKVLNYAEFAIIEFGCLEAYRSRPTPRDILDIMYEKGFCLYDIVGCHYRPYDRALTGGDFFFVKNSSILRKYKGYE